MKQGEWIEIELIGCTPISENAFYYTDFTTMTRHKSKKGRDYASQIAQYVKYIGKPQLGKGAEMFLEIYLTFPEKPKRQRDPGNYLKPIADALKDICWDDDHCLRQIADGEIGAAWGLKIRWGLKKAMKITVELEE